MKLYAWIAAGLLLIGIQWGLSNLIYKAKLTEAVEAAREYEQKQAAIAQDVAVEFERKKTKIEVRTQVIYRTIEKYIDRSGDQICLDDEGLKIFNGEGK